MSDIGNGVLNQDLAHLTRKLKQTVGATAGDFSISNVSGSAFATLGTSSDIQGKDANYTINGVSLTSSSNKIEDVVSGVTLSLNKVGSAYDYGIKDEEAVTKKISDFVSAHFRQPWLSPADAVSANSGARSVTCAWQRWR